MTTPPYYKKTQQATHPTLSQPPSLSLLPSFFPPPASAMVIEVNTKPQKLSPSFPLPRPSAPLFLPPEGDRPKLSPSLLRDLVISGSKLPRGFGVVGLAWLGGIRPGRDDLPRPLKLLSEVLDRFHDALTVLALALALASGVGV